MRSSLLLCAVTVSLLSTAATAQTLIEGFDGAAALANGSPAVQSQNCTTPRGSASNANATYILQGAASCQITNTWLLDAAATQAADPYEVGPPTQLYWSIRAHYGATTAIAKAYDAVEVDVYNASNYAVDAAIMINDGAYKRNAWKSLVPNAWTKLHWDLHTEAGLPAVTGQASGLLGAAAWNFRGIAIHTTTQPAAADFTMYVDNLVGITAQVDTTAPAAPQIMKLEQGSAPGKLKVTWLANDAGDGVAKYTINYLDAASWQRSFPNRMNTSVVATSVDVAGASSTFGEVDVATDQPCYIFVTATDGATPVPNVSNISRILGARLAADGTAPKTLLVLDNNRFTAALGVNFTTYGYEQMSAYFAEALSPNSEPYACASSAAVASGVQTLTAAADRVVVWGSGMDGNTSVTALNTANAAALTAFSNGGGKLFLTGSKLANGLFDAETPVSLKTFGTDIAKINLVTNNAAVAQINNLDADPVFGSVVIGPVGAIATGADVFYCAAGAVTGNDSLQAIAGATAAGIYGTGADGGVAIVYHGQKVVTTGFGIEQVRDQAADTADVAGHTAGVAKRAALMKTVLAYLRGQASVSDWCLY